MFQTPGARDTLHTWRAWGARSRARWGRGPVPEHRSLGILDRNLRRTCEPSRARLRCHKSSSLPLSCQAQRPSTRPGGLLPESGPCSRRTPPRIESATRLPWSAAPLPRPPAPGPRAALERPIAPVRFPLPPLPASHSPLEQWRPRGAAASPSRALGPWLCTGGEGGGGSWRLLGHEQANVLRTHERSARPDRLTPLDPGRGGRGLYGCGGGSAGSLQARRVVRRAAKCFGPRPRSPRRPLAPYLARPPCTRYLTCNDGGAGRESGGACAVGEGQRFRHFI